MTDDEPAERWLRQMYLGLAHNAGGGLVYWMSLPISEALRWSADLADLLKPKEDGNG
jgi:hypothetical protein